MVITSTFAVSEMGEKFIFDAVASNLLVLQSYFKSMLKPVYAMYIIVMVFTVNIKIVWTSQFVEWWPIWCY